MIIFKQRINIVLLNKKYKRSFFILIRILQSVFDTIKSTLTDEQRSKWEEYKAKKETARDYLLKVRATNERNLGDTTTLYYTDEEKQEIAKRIEALPSIEVAVDNASLSKADIKNVLSSTGEIVNQYDGTSAVFPKSSAWKIGRVIGKYYSGIVPHLGEIFSNSVLFGISNDTSSQGKERKSNVKQYKHYIGKVKYDNKNFYLHFTVMEMNGSNNLIHGLNISDVRKYKTKRAASSPSNKMATTTLLDYRVSDFFADVKKKDIPTMLFYTDEIKNKFIKLIEDVRLMKGSEIVRNRYKVEKKNYKQQELKTKYDKFSFEIANKREILPSEKDIGGFFARENIQVSFLNEQQKLGLKSPDAMLNKRLIIEMKTLNKNVQNLVEATTRNLFNGLKIQNGESLVDVVVISLNDVQTQLNNIGKENYINSGKENYINSGKIQGALSTKETFRKTFNEVWIINNDGLIKLKREKGESASINTGILMGGNQHTLLSPSFDYNINDELQNVNKNNIKSYYYTEEEASDVIDRLTDDEAINPKYSGVFHKISGRLNVLLVN